MSTSKGVACDYCLFAKFWLNSLPSGLENTKILIKILGGGGDFDIKVTGMLVVSLRVVIADFSLT